VTLAVIALYFAVLIGVGLAGRRALAATGEDFFAASRSIGGLVLLASLFGTHMTAFSLLGASGEAYRRGVGVFSLMASSSALVVPAVFLFAGTRIWALGRRNGYLTQVELFRDRWGSERLGLALFAVLTLLLVPYLLIGVAGGGLTLAEITGGRVPRWLGSLLVCGVVTAYVTAGGMRATAWANTLQTAVFMVLGGTAFAVLVGKAGGLGAALGRVDPALLFHGAAIPPAELVSYTLIPLSAAMFPHLFAHWLTARRAAAFRPAVVGYPLCLVAVWVPSVLLGVIGSAELPGLTGPAANGVLVRLIETRAPEALAGLLAAGVCAAVMSSLDSQALALAVLFTRETARRRARRADWAAGRSEQIGGGLAEGTAAGSSGIGAAATSTAPAPASTAPAGTRGGEVRAGRLFVAGVLTATFALSLVAPPAIFRLGVWSFTGFAALFPLLAAALWWRRATRAGAWASLATAAGLWLGYFAGSGGGDGATAFGLLPVAVIVAASAAAMVGVSLLTRPPGPEALARFFPAEAA
jgi:SSS family solute:Na+ symporter